MVLGLGGTIVVAVTATLAAIGAASIPSAGLVTMLMVPALQASAFTSLCSLRQMVAHPSNFAVTAVYWRVHILPL